VGTFVGTSVGRLAVSQIGTAGHAIVVS